MSVYVIAQPRFTDVSAYRRYQQAFPAVFDRNRGLLLAADEAPVLLEGAPKPDKVVVLEFADEADAARLLHDPEYQRIGLNRKAGAEVIAIIVRGTPPGTGRVRQQERTS